MHLWAAVTAQSVLHWQPMLTVFRNQRGCLSQNEDTQPTCPTILSTPSNSTLGGVLRLRTQLSTLGVLSLPSVGVSSSRCYVTLFLPNSFLWSCFLIV